jgi:hypothetical protein
MKGKRPYVIEANGTTKINSLKRFIKRGTGKKFVVLRLKNSLNKRQQLKLVKEGKRYIGKKYDGKFGWSDKRIYCSELVFKIYKRALNITLNKPEKIGDFYSSWNPITLKFAKRVYGKRIPFNEKIITPKRLYDSDLLATIYNNYYKLN